jgi:hypothetical protein
MSAGAILAMTLGVRATAQTGQSSAAPARNPTPATMPLATLQGTFVRFPLPPGQDAYADIDGRKMHPLEFHQYFHTDLETPQTVPWTGLEASTRAYAKIVDEVNKLPLSAFQRPEEPAPTGR